MSMNLFIKGTRKIIIPQQLGMTDQVEAYEHTVFEAWSTPTEVTYRILSASNRVQAYIDWVISRNIIERNVPYFDEHDFFCEEPIGYKDENLSEALVEEFKKFLAQANKSGYAINFEII